MEYTEFKERIREVVDVVYKFENDITELSQAEFEYLCYVENLDEDTQNKLADTDWDRFDSLRNDMWDFATGILTDYVMEFGCIPLNWLEHKDTLIWCNEVEKNLIGGDPCDSDYWLYNWLYTNFVDENTNSQLNAQFKAISREYKLSTLLD